MPVYVVTCDPRVAGNKAGAIDQILRRHDECLRPLPNTWIVHDTTTARMLYAELADTLTPEDGLLIVRAGTEAKWQGVNEATQDWMEEQFPREQIP